MLIAGIPQLIVGLMQRKHGGVAAQNGVRAANWGLMQMSWFIVLIAGVVLVPVVGTETASGSYTLPRWYEGVMFTIIALYMLLGVMQLIYAIVGLLKANKGEVVRLPVIPFFKVR